MGQFVIGKGSKDKGLGQVDGIYTMGGDSRINSSIRHTVTSVFWNTGVMLAKISASAGTPGQDGIR